MTGMSEQGGSEPATTDDAKGWRRLLLVLLAAPVVIAVVVVVVVLTGREGATSISRAQMEEAGETWPLTVSEVEVVCPGANRLVVLAEGRSYALNGLAAGAGFADPDPIWADDAEVSGLKADMSDLTDRAAEVCDS